MRQSRLTNESFLAMKCGQREFWENDISLAELVRLDNRNTILKVFEVPRQKYQDPANTQS
jgi:hypothetical protein